MKIVILTRTGFHHTAFINRIQEQFEVACVARELYPEQKKETFLAAVIRRLSGSAEGRDALSLREFHERYSAGFRYHRLLREYLRSPFDVVIEKPGTRYLNIPCGGINSGGFASFLKELRPDIVAVLGSSVIKPEIISIPSAAMLNLHSGLSPYYRGTWSYGWPLVNGEPEYIGATLHHIDPGIDTGNIIFQTRPVLSEADDLNTIFLKVIAEGIELMVDALGTIISRGTVASCRQPEDTGRMYRMKDLTADAVRTCLANLEQGVIGSYLSQKADRDSKVTLYGYVPPKIHL